MIKVVHISIVYQAEKNRFIVEFNYIVSGIDHIISAWVELDDEGLPEKELIMKAAHLAPLKGMALAVANYLDQPSKIGVSSAPVNAPVINPPIAAAGISTAVEVLPGVLKIANHPVTGGPRRIKEIIMDLNDNYKWSREKIADWLDTLDVDLRFKPPSDTLEDERRKALKANKEWLANCNRKIEAITKSLEQLKAECAKTTEIIKKLEQETNQQEEINYDED